MTTSIRSEASRSVIVVNGADKLAINEDGSMEILSPAANPAGNDIPTAGQLPFTKFYESAGQTITANGTLSLAHGLGETPKLIQLQLRCTVAANGYVIGDVIPIHPNAVDAGANYGVIVIPNATNINLRYGNSASVFLLLNNSTGTIAAVANGSFELIVRAWA